MSRLTELIQSQTVVKVCLMAAPRVVLGIVAIFGATWICLSRGRHFVEPVLYAVEGIISVNGAPAQNVNVAFHPLNGDVNAFCPVGRTDSKGIFHLTTNSCADGAPAGEYNVTFVWPDASIEIDECECPDPLIHDRFKGLYATADQSGYRVTVSIASNSFRFNVWRPRSDDPLP